MPSIDISSYKKLYLQTAAENCEALLKSCSQLLQDASGLDALQNIYINAHSLKSKSQVMGYSKIEQLSGMIEKTAKKFLGQGKKIPEDLINSMKKSATEIKMHLRNI